MKLRVPSLLVMCALSACGTTRSRAARATNADDVAAAMARVEHGLAPEVRFAGERGGWSIDERLRALRVPGVSIAVIHDGRVAWAKAYGVADVPSGRRMDVDTRFGVASISKMATGIVALQLVDRGQVALDADINQALRSWKVPENELTRGHPVTLRQLLSHSGGINLHTVLGYEPDAPLPTLPQILDGVAPANTAPVRVEYVPGKEFHYSGGGLLIVQQLILDLVGQPFAQLMQERLFAPLGLTHTTFALHLSPDERAHAATAHNGDESVWPTRVYPDAAPAGLWTTPSDWARLLIEVQRGLNGRSSVISRAMAQAMTTPLVPLGVPDVWTSVGAFVERHGHTMYFGHDGHNPGFMSVSRMMTTGGDGAVVMTNGEGGAELIFEILRSIAAEYKWEGWLKPPLQPVAMDAARLRGFVGRYAVGLDRVVEVVMRDGQLELRAPFVEAQRLVAIGGDTFVSRSDGTRLQFR
ncbi:MAG TPA: serine hydrolase domain-containing protein, partial [Polyangia bacterium]|nr:serine hydrolase domain-containing protein [Polyangia bacterium]